MWSNSSAFVLGRTGTNHVLTITDGGKVYGGDYSYLGQAGYSVARIAGPGSELLVNLLGANRRLYIGGGTGNEVEIESGGRVDCGACAMFYATTSTQNMFRISGPNSALDCTGLTVADKGFGNRLTVTNGGLVRTGNGTLGGAGAISNAVLVTGTASVWTNSGVLTVGSGSGAIGNALTIANGGAVFGRDYSYLGSGQTGGSSDNEVLVTGPGSRLYIAPAGANRRLYIGWSGGNNRVTVRDGGLLDNGDSTVGYGAGGTQGTVRVEGPGSLWRSGGALTLGRAGAGNRLMIEAGGEVECTTSMIGSQANNNTAFVSGSGSLWRVNGALTVGAAGNAGNALVMGEGGRVTVSGNVAVNAGNAVTNYVSGYSGGLDLTTSTATLTLDGTMAVNFAGDPLVKGLYWGFRWAGNHTNALQQLINAGSLTVDDSGLAPFLQGKAGLHYDTTNSYVGLVVTRVPLPSERSTVILVR